MRNVSTVDDVEKTLRQECEPGSLSPKLAVDAHRGPPGHVRRSFIGFRGKSTGTDKTADYRFRRKYI